MQDCNIGPPNSEQPRRHGNCNHGDVKKDPTADWIWGTCIVGTALISILLAFSIDSIRFTEKEDLKVTVEYRVGIILTAIGAGALWGLLARSSARKYGRGAWAVVIIGLLGAVVIGQGVLKWLQNAQLSDLFFPITRAAWNHIVNGPEGFMLFLVLLPFTFFVDVLLLIPTAMSVSFMPIIALSGGPLVGGALGSLFARLSLRFFGREQTDPLPPLRRRARN